MSGVPKVIKNRSLLDQGVMFKPSSNVPASWGSKFIAFKAPPGLLFLLYRRWILLFLCEGGGDLF
jgi:hypothetical protein